MKIILARTFIADFDKEFKKYSINHLDLVTKLKETKMIRLKNPYVKVKTYIKTISIRWICVVNDVGTLIPVYCVLKKNKKDGMNLVLDTPTLSKMNTLLGTYSVDFTNGDYLEF